MKKKIQVGLIFVALLIAGTGCQNTSQGGKTYTRGQAQTALQVYQGTVLRVEDVTIQAQDTGGGAVGGAVVGGVVGSTIGKGRGKKLATTAGAVAGSRAGSASERSRGRKAAVEIEVELNNGKIIMIVQEKDDIYAVGDSVRIIQANDGSMRVRQ